MGVDTEATLIETMETALSEGITPDIALLTGDLVQDPEPATYRRLSRILARLPCPVYCLPGNHDDPALMASCLVGEKIQYQSSIVLDSWHIICLDSRIPGSPKGLLSDDQLQLLEYNLNKHPDLDTLIALHHHPIPTGSDWMDTMQLQNSGVFFERLEVHPRVRGVVFGHIHQAMETGHRGIRLLGTPSSCFQFMPGRDEFTLDALPTGYRWLELTRQGSIDTWISRTRSPPAGLTISSKGY